MCNRINVRTAGTTGVWAAALLAAVAGTTDAQATRPALPVKPPVKPVITVSADAMAAAYANDPSAAEARFNGSTVEVTGEVVSRMGGVGQGQAMVTLAARGGGALFSRVRCRLAAEHLADVESARPHATVTVSGRVAGLEDGTVVVERCELLASAPGPRTPPPAAPAAPATAGAVPTAPTTLPAAAIAPAAKPHRVCFLVDASGSMVNRMAKVKEEVGRAINGLAPDQKFDVIVVQENKVRVASRGLASATTGNKAAQYAFLTGVVARGGTDILPGLQAAAALRAEVVWVATDGDVPDAKKSVREAASVARRVGMKVNTVLHFASDGPGQEPAPAALEFLVTGRGDRRGVPGTRRPPGTAAAPAVRERRPVIARPGPPHGTQCVRPGPMIPPASRISSRHRTAMTRKLTVAAQGHL